jgi:hypothetical protein
MVKFAGEKIGSLCPEKKIYVTIEYCREICGREPAIELSMKSVVAIVKRKNNCCGKMIKSVAKLLGSYIRGGKIRLQELEKILFPNFGPELGWVIERKNACMNCDKITWMTRHEYVNWLIKNYKSIADKLKETDTLMNALLLMPPLPIQKTGSEYFCSLCKCWLPAKLRDWNMKCNINKWLSTGF